MSDDDSGRASGPSNPWRTVPEVNRPSTAPEREPVDRRPYSVPPTAHGAGKVVYDDSQGGLAGLTIMGYLLTMITLGIYRFWYLTNLRRFFWSHTSVHQSPLEYTGRGLEIFIGFLIALAVIVPLNLVPLAFVTAFGPGGQLVSFVLVPVYAILIFFAFYRSRRYRVNRTLWRGLRAHQTGAGWAYAFRALGWMLLGILTLGLIVPMAVTDLYRYRISRMYLGSVPFTFVGDWRMIARPYFVPWAIFMLPLLVLIGITAVVTDAGTVLSEAMRTGEIAQHLGERTGEAVQVWASILAPVLFLWFLFPLLVVPYYYARRTSALFSATQLQGVRCSVTIRARSLYAIYGLYLLLVLVIFGVGGGIIGGLGFSIGSSANSASGPIATILSFGGIFISYLVVIILLGIAAVLMLQRRIWKLVAGSITILNPELLDELAGRMHDSEGGFGAGMADALDVGDFDIGL